MDRRGDGGFTLIEVTAALLIVMVAIYAALDLFVHSRRYQAGAWNINTASFAAAAVLEQMKRASFEEVVDMPRSVHPEYPFYDYSVSVSPGVFENMKTVTVSVFYRSGGGEKKLSLMMEKFKR